MHVIQSCYMHAVCCMHVHVTQACNAHMQARRSNNRISAWIQHMLEIAVRFRVGMHGVALKHAHASITANNVQFWITWPFALRQQHSPAKQFESVAPCANMAQVIKQLMTRSTLYTAGKAHLYIKDSAIFLCICSVLIRLPRPVAFV